MRRLATHCDAPPCRRRSHWRYDELIMNTYFRLKCTRSIWSFNETFPYDLMHLKQNVFGFLVFFSIVITHTINKDKFCLEHVIAHYTQATFETSARIFYVRNSLFQSTGTCVYVIRTLHLPFMQSIGGTWFILIPNKGKESSQTYGSDFFVRN